MAGDTLNEKGEGRNDPNHTGDEIHEAVQQHYSAVPICYPEQDISSWGYDCAWLDSLGVPRDVCAAASGGGCPLKLGPVNPGEIVMDLGCGGGHDLVIAAHLVGDTGKVIGIDMTAEMLQRARQNAERCGVEPRVQFVQAGIETNVCETCDDNDAAWASVFCSDCKAHYCGDCYENSHRSSARKKHKTKEETALSIPEGVADIVYSNGVFNLCYSKAAAFRTAYRALKPGGRLYLCDVMKQEAAQSGVAVRA